MVNPGYVDSRIGVGITALLILGALQLSNSSSLPDVSYLARTEEATVVTRGDRRGLAVPTGLYFVIAGVLIALSLA